MPPSAICACSDSSVRRPPLAPSALFFACSSRNAAICRALAASATWNTSPGCGRPVRPSTSTGVDGPADFVGRPRSSMSARTRPTTGPAMNVSPTFSVPSCTSTVATGPRPLSSFDSSTVPEALRLGFALSSPISLTSRIISSSRSMFVRFFADTSTVTVFPPHSSGIKSSSVNSRLTRSATAFGLSTLLIATMIGTFAALAWSIASRVCGITPSSAATTSTTMSVTFAPRARMSVNASWPGVSRNTMLRLLIVTWYAPMCCVMPPASRSATRASRMASSRLVLP